jgi:exopolysaccharide production protein ExoY
MVPARNAWPVDAVRRLVDIAVAVVGLALSAPFVVVAAVLIKIEDGGPILYRRRVLGRGATEFDGYKLRTMRVDADAWLEGQREIFERYRVQTKLENDPRVTRVGRVLRRFHLDELPQFLNVLAGQMSIVGPRMIHPSELGKFGDFGPVRLAVRPGVTGLWQVVKSTYGYDERVVLDKVYISHRSLTLDLRIMVFTIPSIIGWRGHWALLKSGQVRDQL